MGAGTACGDDGRLWDVSSVFKKTMQKEFLAVLPGRRLFGDPFAESFPLCSRALPAQGMCRRRKEKEQGFFYRPDPGTASCFCIFGQYFNRGWFLENI